MRKFAAATRQMATPLWRWSVVPMLLAAIAALLWSAWPTLAQGSWPYPGHSSITRYPGTTSITT